MELLKKNKTVRKFIRDRERNNDHVIHNGLKAEKKELKSFGCSKCNKKFKKWERAKFIYEPGGYNMELAVYHVKCCPKNTK